MSVNRYLAELVTDTRAVLGEGPLWNASGQVLYWLDIFGKKLHAYHPAEDRTVTVDTPRMVACLGLRAAGGLVCGTDSGLELLDPRTGALTPVENPEAGLPENRFNDGKVDPQGRWVAGTMSTKGIRAAGSLYRFSPGGLREKLLSNVTNSNGLDWSPRGDTLYYIDSGSLEILAFPYAPCFSPLGKPRVVVTVSGEDGTKLLDGMTVDAGGMLWVAQFGAGKISRWNPENGRLLGEVTVPAPRVTSCAFGGPDLETLYITTATVNLTEAQAEEFPRSGGLFLCRPGVKGKESFTYAG